jgi:hypothetical protein
MQCIILLFQSVSNPSAVVYYRIPDQYAFKLDTVNKDACNSCLCYYYYYYAIAHVNHNDEFLKAKCLTILMPLNIQFYCFEKLCVSDSSVNKLNSIQSLHLSLLK